MVQVKSIMMPNMFDNITVYNNLLVVAATAVYIPVGYYTITELMTVLSSLTSWTWSCTTGSNPRVSVVKAGASVLFNVPEGLASVLGADPTATYAASPAATAFREPPNLLGPQIVHLSCPQLATGNHINWEGVSHNVVETMSMADTVRGSYLYHHQASIPNQLDYHFPREISTLDFLLLDHLFRPIDLPSNYQPYIQLRIWSVDN